MPILPITLWGMYMLKKIQIKILFFCLLFLSTACLKQSESITPLAQPVTLAQLQKESLMAIANQAGGYSELSTQAQSTLALSTDPSIFYLNVTYNIQNIDVFAVANIPNTFEQIGNSFLMKLAEMVLAIGGPQNVSLNAFTFAVPNINIDRDLVKSITVKRVFLQYNALIDQQSDYAANFTFINTLELARVINIGQVGKVDSLLLTYQKSHNACLFKCIQFDIIDGNILDLIEPHSTITIQPSLSIASIPAVTNITLDGYVELQIGLKLPF